MTFRNALGQYAGSYWKSLSRNQKQMAVALCILAAWVSFCLAHQFVTEVVLRELKYVAAGKAEAAEFKIEQPARRMDVVLEAIAKCESGGQQFYSDGRVVLNVNKDGSADVGKWQVNLRYHGAQIARMKLDVVNSEEDNRKFAEYLYERNGTADWSASKHCHGY